MILWVVSLISLPVRSNSVVINSHGILASEKGLYLVDKSLQLSTIYKSIRFTIAKN